MPVPAPVPVRASPPSQASAPVPGGPADPATPSGAPVGSVSTSGETIGIGPVPDPPRSRRRALVAGGVTLAVVVLGVAGVVATLQDRPSAAEAAPALVGAQDGPVGAPGAQPSDGADEPDPRGVEARTRLADAVETGRAVHEEAAARSAASSAALRSLRGALDAAAAALSLRTPSGKSPEQRTLEYVDILEVRRSAVLDATSVVADALAGRTSQRPSSTTEHGDTTTPTGAGTGTAGDGGAGTGTSGDGDTDAGSGGGTEPTGGTGSAGGSTATPTATPPAATAEPTAGPSAEPTPEPTPDPTPEPTVSPTPTPEPTDTPQAGTPQAV